MTERRVVQPEGRRWRDRHPSPVALLLVAGVFMTGTWWRAEWDSCNRANSNRTFMREILNRADPLGELPRPKPLQCNRVFPENGRYPAIK